MLRYEPLASGAGWDADIPGGAPSSPSQRALRFSRSQLWLPVSIAAILASDLLALFLALYFGGWVSSRYFIGSTFVYSGRETLFLLFPVAYAAADLYPGFGLGAVTTIRRLTYCTCLGFVIVILVGHTFAAQELRVGTGVLLSWLLLLAMVPLCRFATLSVASGFRWWGFPTVIIGNRQAAELTIRTLRNAFSLGYRVVGVILLGETFAKEVEGIPVLGDLGLASRLRQTGVRAAIVWDNSESIALVADLQRHFPHVILVRDECALPIEHVRVRNLGGVVGIEFTSQLFHRRNRFLKRSLDLVLGTICVIVTSPLILVSGLAIKFFSPGPMFYSQEREGLNGLKFKVLKLRTMHTDAEARLKAILAENPKLQKQWQESLKLTDDPRIVPVVGELLRRFSIDELPQLFAVLSGEMSLVGPRPFPEYHLSLFDPVFRQFRSVVRPGLTGMWQVMIRSAGDIKAQERYDTFYIMNWSLWLDAYILVRTVVSVLAGSGAY